MPRILTYNVHRCFGPDGQLSPRRIVSVIASTRPDIVALQELDVGRSRSGQVDQAKLIAHELGMTFHFHPTVHVMEEQYGDAILTPHPCKLIKAGLLSGRGWLPGESARGAMWVSVALKGGDIHVINTHLGLVPGERASQVTRLLGPEWLGSEEYREPLILAGDLNAPPQGRSCRRLAARLRARPAGGRARSTPTFPSPFPVLRLDHIFASSSVKLTAMHVVHTPLARAASDHLPLIADFELLPAEQWERPAPEKEELSAVPTDESPRRRKRLRRVPRLRLRKS